MTAHKHPVTAYSLDSKVNDEIDLMLLVDILWRGKLVLAAVLALCLVFAVVYLVVTPSRYLISEKIYPIDNVMLVPVAPTESESLLEYAVDMQGVEVLYQSIIDGLSSLEYQKQFWQRQASNSGDLSGEYTELEAAEIGDFLRFSHSIEVAEAVNGGMATVMLKGTEASLITEQLINFLDHVSAKVAAKSLGRVLDAINVNILRIDDAMHLARIQADAKIRDKIASIEEALIIAKALGIREPEFSRLANIEITLFNSRQYLLGEKALASELEALQQRRNRDAFVDGLRELQAAKALLIADRERIGRNLTSFRPVVYSESISPPLTPVWPRINLVLAVACLFGGVLGILVVFARHVVKGYRAKQKAISGN